jgi:putative toxin-antitoxin system antitoxin component (TIGR02293 family)
MARVISLLQRLENMLDRESVQDEQSVVRLIEERLPTKAVAGLRGLGLTDDEIHSLVLPRRTMSHRVARRERLSSDESDRVVRILRVIDLGERAFGDRDRFWHWFRAPQRQLDDRSPLQMLRTEAGGRLVENLLIGLEEGFVA